MNIYFERAEDHANNIATLWFRPGHPLHYEAGQFVNIRLPHEHADSRGNARVFTLTSSPNDSLLSVLVRFPDNPSSYKQAMRSLRYGAKLAIEEPLGDFILPKSPSIPLVWLAGGIGSAAFVSMAKVLASKNERRNITLFQSARHAREYLFGDVWKTAGLTLQQAATRDHKWQGRTIRFTADDLLQAAGDQARETMFYLSGPEQMVEEIATGLVVKGVRRDYIVREAFTGY